MLETRRIGIILVRMVRRRIWNFIGKFWMILSPWIVCNGVGVIVRHCIEAVKGICLFNGEVSR